MQDIQNRQKHAHQAQKLHGVFKRLRGLGRVLRGDEAGKQRFAKEQHRRADQRRGQHPRHHAGAHAPADAAIGRYAEVLPHVDGHGVAKGGGGDLQDAVELVGGGISGHEDDVEAVDHALHDHAAHGDDHVLHRHRRAQRHQAQAEPDVRAQVLPADADETAAPEGAQADERRAALSDDRGDGRALHAHIEGGHEEQVQRDIDRAGEDHRQKRRPAIAHGAEDSRKEVEGHDHRQAPEDDAYVGKRGIDDGRGRFQHAQHEGREQLSGGGERHGADGRERACVADGAPQTRAVLRAKLLRHAHGEALRQPLNDGEHHPVEPVHRAQRRQRLEAEYAADDGRIRHGVELLEGVGHHQRQREREDEPQRAARGHVLSDRLHPFLRKKEPAEHHADAMAHAIPLALYIGAC